jgi:hypothetical protein
MQDQQLSDQGCGEVRPIRKEEFAIADKAQPCSVEAARRGEEQHQLQQRRHASRDGSCSMMPVAS